ncbi:MAG: cupredoxin domain-containing protein, partial [Acidimicrobiia bacterium]|nr:cupredoxin domain-containing protein [Acidimicrobiia bacterium]
ATQAAAERATGGGGYLGGTGPSDADAATGPSIGEAGPERSDRTVAAEAEILIRDFAFSAGTTVGTGRAITVTNVDGVAHTLTASSGLFDTGNLAGGATATLTAPGTAGTYSFFCAIHPSMRGSVTVQ